VLGVKAARNTLSARAVHAAVAVGVLVALVEGVLVYRGIVVAMMSNVTHADTSVVAQRVAAAFAR
jgi:hypothetical protein